jgi:hypothetical protein
MSFFPSLPNPGIFVFSLPIKDSRKAGPVAHPVCSAAIIYNDEMGFEFLLGICCSGPQNNVEGLLVSVSEFEPWAIFAQISVWTI